MNFNQLKTELNKLKTDSNLSRKEMIAYLVDEMPLTTELIVGILNGTDRREIQREAYKAELQKKPPAELKRLYDTCVFRHKDDPPVKPVTIASIVEMLKVHH